MYETILSPIKELRPLLNAQVGKRITGLAAEKIAAITASFGTASVLAKKAGFAMSRQLIADPDWVNKLGQNRASTIRPCVRCNKACLGGMQQHKGVHCIYDKEEVK